MCSGVSGLNRILGLVSTLVLPPWVVPPLHAVEECDRVARRSLELPRYRATSRDSGVAAALVWLTLGEVSPLTQRFSGGTLDPPGATPGDSRRPGAAMSPTRRLGRRVGSLSRARRMLPRPRTTTGAGSASSPQRRRTASVSTRTACGGRCPGCSGFGRTSRSTPAGTAPPRSRTTGRTCARPFVVGSRTQPGTQRSRPLRTRHTVTRAGTGRTFALAWMRQRIAPAADSRPALSEAAGYRVIASSIASSAGSMTGSCWQVVRSCSSSASRACSAERRASISASASCARLTASAVSSTVATPRRCGWSVRSSTSAVLVSRGSSGASSTTVPTSASKGFCSRPSSCSSCSARTSRCRSASACSSRWAASHSSAVTRLVGSSGSTSRARSSVSAR